MNNTEYILCYNEEIIELLPDTEKVFLSNTDIKSELFNICLYENCLHLQEKIDSEQSVGDKMDCFSALLPYFYFQLYNDPDLVKKYPEGFIVDSHVFIPSYIYEKMINEEKEFNNKNNSSYNLCGVLLNHYIEHILEHKYNKECSIEERKNLFQCQKIYKNNSSEIFNIFNKFLRKPSFISHHDLINTAKELNFSNHTVTHLESIASSTDFIDYILSKKEKFANFFNITFEENKTFQIDNLEDLKTLYGNGCSADKLFGVSLYLKEKRNSIIDKHSVYSDVLNELEKEYNLYVCQLNDAHFYNEIKNLFMDLTKKFGNLPTKNGFELDSSSRKALAHSINNQPYCTHYKRELLIKICTDYLTEIPPHRIFYGTKTDYEQYQQYQTACKNSDLAYVQTHSQNGFVNYYFDNIKKDIINSNNSQFVKYFFNNGIPLNVENIKLLSNNFSVLKDVLQDYEFTSLDDYVDVLKNAKKNSELFHLLYENIEQYNNSEEHHTALISHMYELLSSFEVNRHIFYTVFNFLQDDISKNQYLIETMDFSENDITNDLKNMGCILNTIAIAAYEKNHDRLERIIIEQDIPYNEKYFNEYKKEDEKSYEHIERLYQLKKLNAKLNHNLNKAQESNSVESASTNIRKNKM